MEIVGPGPESTRFLHPTAVGSLGEEPDDWFGDLRRMCLEPHSLHQPFLQAVRYNVRGHAEPSSIPPLPVIGVSPLALYTVGRSEARTAAIKTLTDFLDQDPTGTRKMVYRMQVLQELTRTANANGHNTIFLTDLTGPSASILPLPTRH